LLLELLMAQAPGAKPVRDLAAKYGVGEPRFPARAGDSSCIRCALCARVCHELVGACAIGAIDVGPQRTALPPSGEPSDRCIGCGACAQVCPTGVITMEDEQGRTLVHDEITLAPNKAIQVPFLQAVPNTPALDADECIHFQTGGCGVCAEVCETDAVDFEQRERVEEIEVGSIILATGYELMDASEMPEYGYGRLDNVISSLEFDLMNSAAGPTGGQILKADGTPPRTVALLHCTGSRDVNHQRYCSRVCCMYLLKYAHLIKDKIADARVIHFYIDMRCFGKGYEEFYDRVQQEGVTFIRGKAAYVSDQPLVPDAEEPLTVVAENTLLGQLTHVPVDMVVLSPALLPAHDAGEVSRIFGVSRSEDGFFMEKHPKLAPVNTATDGVFLAGTCQGPRDIPDSVAHGCAAASAALSLSGRGEVLLGGETSWIDESMCVGCRTCRDQCAFSAVEYFEEPRTCRVEAALCQGCGACAGACPVGAITAHHFSEEQLLAEIAGIADPDMGDGVPR
jgi:heterodisulfide reductase subunit A